MRKFKHDEKLFIKVRAFIAETNEAAEAHTSGFDFADVKGSNAAAMQLYEGFDFGVIAETNEAAEAHTSGFDFSDVKGSNAAATQLYEGFDFGG
eukprot:6478490-Amphidinium_carterae.1